MTSTSPTEHDRLRDYPAALVYAAGLAPRGASFWAIKTPSVILDEMRAAKSEIEALGRDIYATFRRPFEAQLALAEQRFVARFGRRPGVGRAAQRDDDTILRSLMQPVPTDADWQHKSYQGAFVHAFGELEREFGAFWADHAHAWTDRLWRGTYDRAVEYRKRALAWRQRFIELGGTPTAPAPTPPTEEILPSVSLSWKTVAVVGGVALGALVLVPAALRAARGS
jgi:hypothetical protein